MQDLSSRIGVPISTQNDTLSIESKFVFIEKKQIFQTRDLRSFYLNATTVFPKVLYKSFWLGEHQPLFSRIGVRIKFTMVYPEIIGVEYTKTKTVKSVNYIRVIEGVSGKGIIIMQPDIPHLHAPIVPVICEIEPETKVVIPPNWCYTVVNCFNEVLLLLELLSVEQETCQFVNGTKGAPFYFIERNGIVEVVKNSRYKNVQKYGKLNTEILHKHLGIAPKTAIIKQFLRKHDKFTWFYKPETHQWDTIVNDSIVEHSDPF